MGSAFRLRFRSLFDSGRGYVFPCDGQGEVDLDQLSEAARNNYLYARAMVGRELAVPAVEPNESHRTRFASGPAQDWLGPK